MPARKAPNLQSLRGSSEAIQRLVLSLPSESERDEARRSLESMIAFLRDVSDSLGRLPSRESASGVVHSLTTFDALIEQARSSPLVAATLGIPNSTQPRRSPPPVIEPDRARSLLDEIKRLPSEEIRRRLENPTQTPSNVLRGIAREMGISVSGRAPRSTLVQLISTRIENARGYESLRRGD
jgi:hypothetical protein